MTAAERPEGVPETAQPVTVTMWVEPQLDEYERHYVRWPSGRPYGPCNAEALLYRGIPIPRPPRVGPLGLSEQDTRNCAAWMTLAERGREQADSWDRLNDNAIFACREAVTAWDAEDPGTPTMDGAS